MVTSPRVRNNNSTLSSFFNGPPSNGGGSALQNHQSIFHHNYLFSQETQPNEPALSIKRDSSVNQTAVVKHV